MEKRAEVVQADAGGENHRKLLISRQEHDRALHEGIDVPASRPDFALPLDEVGIANKTVWIHFPSLGHLPFNAEIHVDLPADRRGIHMSRIEQVISRLHNRRFTDPRDYALILARQIMQGQAAKGAVVRLKGQLPFPTRTPVSDELSLDALDTNITACLSSRKTGIAATLKCGVRICHITACPCTQVYNRALFFPPLEAGPPATHSQRSKTSLEIETEALKAPSHLELAQCLNAALHSVQDLLKRSDEAELVLRAHLNPQFAEDAVREVAREAGRRFGKRLPTTSLIKIKSLSLESIHIHDVSCRLTTTLGELLAVEDQPAGR